ncbi:MAG TPA: Ig domain-containing protein, partial [Caldilineaceae bacterium]|nr:Ig domain-containing protein [Caldilineaceae bacterium]
MHSKKRFVLLCWLIALVLCSSFYNPPSLKAQTVLSSPATFGNVTVEDLFGRPLNSSELVLVDWEGYLANPAVQFSLHPPPETAYPATVTLSANSDRLYFNLPSFVGESGPSKTLTLTDTNSPTTAWIAIFPDRDSMDESYQLTISLTDAAARQSITTINLRVIDQDRERPADFHIQVDFSKDQSGLFADPAKQAIVQSAADDWAYFLADMQLDQVPAGAESTWVWQPTGFVTGTHALNPTPYTGFLLYAYGIHTDALRSGGAGSYDGGFQSSHGIPYLVRRSGGIAVETNGNYNSLGWFLTRSDQDWWQSANASDQPHDLYSIMHHEVGHALIFNDAYPRFAEAKNRGLLEDPAILAYHGAPLPIDQNDHMDSVFDDASKKGAYGSDYLGEMPQRRWQITKLDLLAAQAIGYSLRQTSAFVPLTVTPVNLPFGSPAIPYATTLGAVGGVPAYDWSIVSGALPPGLVLNSFTGAITGTPTAPGAFTFMIRLRDQTSVNGGVIIPASMTIADTIS